MGYVSTLTERWLLLLQLLLHQTCMCADAAFVIPSSLTHTRTLYYFSLVFCSVDRFSSLFPLYLSQRLRLLGLLRDLHYIQQWQQLHLVSLQSRQQYVVRGVSKRLRAQQQEYEGRMKSMAATVAAQQSIDADNNSAAAGAAATPSFSFSHARADTDTQTSRRPSQPQPPPDYQYVVLLDCEESFDVHR